MSSWLGSRRQRVDLLLTGGRLLTGDIHLLLVAQTHAGPEEAIDLLNRDEGFFAVTLEGEQPLFIAKSQLLMARLPIDAGAHDPERESAARRLELEVELDDGSLFEGVVRFELPPDRVRLIDFLNLAPPFFALESADAVRLLNCAHIRAVSPLAQVSRAAP